MKFAHDTNPSNWYLPSALFYPNSDEPVLYIPNPMTITTRQTHQDHWYRQLSSGLEHAFIQSDQARMTGQEGYEIVNIVSKRTSFSNKIFAHTY